MKPVTAVQDCVSVSCVTVNLSCCKLRVDFQPRVCVCVCESAASFWTQNQVGFMPEHDLFLTRTEGSLDPHKKLSIKQQHEDMLGSSVVL